MTDVEVPLQCQYQGQPVGDGMEKLRTALQDKLEQGAGEGGPVHEAVLAKGEDIEIPGVGLINAERSSLILTTELVLRWLGGQTEPCTSAPCWLQ